MKSVFGLLLTVMFLFMAVTFASNDATQTVVKPPGVEQTIVSANVNVPVFFVSSILDYLCQGNMPQYGNASPSMETSNIWCGSLAVIVNSENEGIWYPLKTYSGLASLTYNDIYKNNHNSHNVIRGYPETGYSIWS